MIETAFGIRLSADVGTYEASIARAEAARAATSDKSTRDADNISESEDQKV